MVKHGVTLYTPLTHCEEVPDPRGLPIVADDRFRDHIFELVFCRDAGLYPLVSFLIRDPKSRDIYAIPAATWVEFNHGEKYEEDRETLETRLWLMPRRLVKISARGKVTDGPATIRILHDGRVGIIFDDEWTRGTGRETMLTLVPRR